MKPNLTRQAIVVLLCLLCLPALAQLPKEVELRKIWDKAEHSAFTDLIYFKGNFYCSFREGTGHIPKKDGGGDGTVRILKSKDTKNWESVAHLEEEGIDLRDPKLSITPNGRLMVIMGGSIYEGTKLEGRVPHVSFSDKAGKTFSDPQKVVVDPSIVSWGDWLWRVTWHKGTGYTIDYQIGPQERRGPTAMYLLKTTDGIHFTKVSKIDLDGFPNEATVRFDKNDVMHVLIRRETEDQMGVMATSVAPYQKWDYQKLNVRLGGPNFVFTDQGKIVMGTRVYEDKIYTALFMGDNASNLRKILSFPSAGDNSYPGMIIREGALWISYYSSHEGKSSIYFAKVPLSFLNKQDEAPALFPSGKIWDRANHSAFTDLIRFKGKFFCVFREGQGHSPAHSKPDEDADGVIRVISSVDGVNWEDAGVIREKGIDLRDPKLALHPDGRLMITSGGSDYRGPNLVEWHTRVMFSDDGRSWTEPLRVRGIPGNNWFFRLTWQGDEGYVAANICKTDARTGKVNTRDRKLIVYKTIDGINYEQVSDDFNPMPQGCEATIAFKEDSTMVIAIRDAQANSSASVLAFSSYPYKKFNFIPLDHGLGGPNLLQVGDNRWLLGTRQNETQRPASRKGPATVLLLVDDKGVYERLFELPSGGDTSYPGFVVHEGKLWISYYSTHEGKSSIYLSVIPLDKIRNNAKGI